MSFIIHLSSILLTILGLMCRIDEEYFKTSMEGYLEDASTILELFKASHLSFLSEISLKDLGIWTRDLLAKQVSKPKHNLRLKEVSDRNVQLLVVAFILIDVSFSFIAFA